MAAEASKEFRATVRSQLSETLIIRQDLTTEQIDRIVELQISKHYLHKQMQEASISCQNELLRELAQQATDIDFMLQTAWNFKQDETHHRFWTLPGCICPVIINIEKYPSTEYEYTKTCPIHGSTHK